MDAVPDFEKKVQTIGRELSSRMREVPPVLDSSTWIGRVMAWAMKNEEFKTRLFRFVDVLPSLGNDQLVIGLLREYFGSDGEVPKIVRRGIEMIPEKGLVTRIAGPIIRKSVASIARQFIVRNTVQDLKKALEALRADGTLFSVDMLGELVVSEKEAREYRDSYLTILDGLHSQFPAGPDISLKVSSFYSQLDPVDWQGSLVRAKEALQPVLRKAKELSISVTIDMEHYYIKSLIIAVFKSIIEDDKEQEVPQMGLALQTYLKDSEQDIRELIAWARNCKRKIAIRLVKGAYWDYEVSINRQREWPVPVFLNKEETDTAFERLTRLLMENADALYPAVATHNTRSIAYAISVADSLSLSKRDFEFQMLYGMAEPLRKAVREQGFAVRVYTPVGELVPGMAYLVRRLLENTSNSSFLRRSFTEKNSIDELVRPPVVHEPRPVRQKARGEFRNEPLLDFSLEKNRKRMADAIQATKQETGKRYPLLIGERIVLETEHEIISRNPTRPEQIVGRVASASRKEADDAIKQALAAAKNWQETEPETRAAYLYKAAEEIRKRRVDLAALEVIEVGKSWKDADGDVAEAIDYLEYCGKEMVRLGKPKRMGDYPGEENRYYYVPKGIGVVIAPWNFPLAIAAGMTSAALVSGNCAIFKPSGLSPVIGYKLSEIFRSVGVPPGVLQFVPGPGSEVGEYLVTHPAVDFIAFTGSKNVGLRIVRLAAETGAAQRNIKKVIAELGGKNAVIVDETADLDEAVKDIVESAFGYQGQKCSACSRVIAVGSIFNELSGRLVEAVSSLRIGPTEDPGNILGPVIDQSAVKKIRSYIEIGKQEGKTILERHESGEGYFIGPVLFIDAPADSRIATEEIFGPVLTMIRVKNIEEGIALANKSQYALTGGLFSRSPLNIEKAKKQFMTGNLYINRKITGALVGRQPFGGFGMSGVGSKAGGPDYLLQFMNPVSVTENTIRRGFAPME